MGVAVARFKESHFQPYTCNPPQSDNRRIVAREIYSLQSFTAPKCDRSEISECPVLSSIFLHASMARKHVRPRSESSPYPVATKYPYLKRLSKTPLLSSIAYLSFLSSILNVSCFPWSPSIQRSSRIELPMTFLLLLLYLQPTTQAQQ